ncbi:hypothetical protein ASE12_17440 [Aeromicrobium sp. Root236]|uniref:hypothetical protein n=1 Tax=Aeromicrobium sp. Root236 TaxID=1736498 RepID=UPI0006F1E156|nr:hypothetical protein [Aeromicrobium sp. Root236]KRC66387.1 hypothetical protein ASE12_17440 [Aeromicrobium sp. Root236]
MRGTSIVLVAILGITLSGCHGSSGDASPATEASPAKASRTPAPEETYVPRPGDPKTHVLRLTIRDVAGIDAYATDREGCPVLGPANLPPQVYVAGPNTKEPTATFTTVDVPKDAEPIMGACEAHLTITVPYAPRYTIGIASEGQGISRPDAPPPSWIITKGASQKVTLVSQVVQTLR